MLDIDSGLAVAQPHFRSLLDETVSQCHSKPKAKKLFYATGRKSRSFADAQDDKNEKIRVAAQSRGREGRRRSVVM